MYNRNEVRKLQTAFYKVYTQKYTSVHVICLCITKDFVYIIHNLVPRNIIIR